MKQRLLDILAQGEGLSVEFKRCGGLPEKDTFETVCSFANRQGGHIILGVNDDGSVEGVSKNAVRDIERNIVNVTSNPNMFNVPPSLEFFHDDIDGKCVVDVWVPMGPGVYRFKGVAYDRIADVDVRLKGDEQVSAMYLRKQNLYTEQRVYPHVAKGDLDMSLLDRARDMIRFNRPDHPWLGLSDDDLLRAARLHAKDFQTGEEGFNLAGIMLLGSDETIFGVCPAYRTDATLRRDDADRYDDRLVVRTNLVDSYYQLGAFCRRWLPDPFALDGDRRISVRDAIVRELVANTLIHREYSSPFIAQLTIDSEGLGTRNASRCLFSGRISPDNFSPTPKNPIIADFFVQIGLAEELGSGTRNLFKCSRLYTGEEPELDDGDFFNAFVPVPRAAVTGDEGGKEPSLAAGRAATVEQLVAGLLAKQGFVTTREVTELTGGSQRTTRRYLAAMVDAGALAVDRRGRSTVYRLP